MQQRLGLVNVLAALCGFSCLLAVGTAHADTVDDGYFAAKLMLGVAGEAEVESDAVGLSSSSDLELTYGAGVQYMHPLHEYFALGGQVALLSWQTEAGDAANADRNLLLDVSLVPALRYAIEHDAELYLAIPVGLALDFPGEDSFGVGEVSTGVGLNVAFMAGARFALADGFGLLGELGYALHAFSHEVSGEVAGISAETEFDVSMGQLAINLGVFFY